MVYFPLCAHPYQELLSSEKDDFKLLPKAPILKSDTHMEI